MSERKPKGPLITPMPTRCRVDMPNCADNECLRAVLKGIVRPSSVLRKAGNAHLPQLSRLSGMAGLSRSALTRFQSGRVLVMGEENRARVWEVLEAEGLWFRDSEIFHPSLDSPIIVKETTPPIVFPKLWS